MNTPGRSGVRRCFTLLEMLVVVALVAVASGLAVGGLAAPGRDARLRAAIAAVLDLDRRARLCSRTGYVSFLEVTSEHDALRLTMGPNHDVLAEDSLPDGASLAVVDPLTSDPIGRVRIGTDGRSRDYGVIMTMWETERAWCVSGLTGWVRSMDNRP